MNILVVYCHPVPTSFNAAVRDRAVATLRRGGHEVRVDDLYADGFEPRLTADERAVHLESGVSVELQDYADNLRWCDALVFVYPTWWSGLPAVLKGWLDRVWCRGVAWDLPAGTSTVRGRLRNVRRIAAITTHGSPKRINLLEGQAGKRIISRTLRALCNPFTRVLWLPMYGLDASTDAQRQAFLENVEKRLSRW